MKKIIIIGLGVLLLLLLIIMTLMSMQHTSTSPSPQQTATTPTQVPNTFNPYNSPDHSTPKNEENAIVLPNESSKQVIATLGSPAATTTEKQYTVYSYPIPGTTRVSKVYLENQTVMFFMKEITDDNTLYSDYVSTHNKTEDGVLYDPNFAGIAFNWYVFAEDGIAFLANKDNGYTLKVLYFPKMSYTQFLQTGAQDFSLSQQNPDQNEGFK